MIFCNSPARLHLSNAQNQQQRNLTLVHWCATCNRRVVRVRLEHYARPAEGHYSAAVGEPDGGGHCREVRAVPHCMRRAAGRGGQPQLCQQAERREPDQVPADAEAHVRGPRARRGREPVRARVQSLRDSHESGKHFH